MFGSVLRTPLSSQAIITIVVSIDVATRLKILENTKENVLGKHLVILKSFLVCLRMLKLSDSH